MTDQLRFRMKCRLCGFHRTVLMSGMFSPDLTEEEAKLVIADWSLRAEESFFQDHWTLAHVDEATEISHHIEQVAKLARVTAYHKRVLDGTFGDQNDESTQSN